MRESSGHSGQENHAPILLFAAVDLMKGSGGIAELSRQVLMTLMDMHHKELIRLKVHVLKGIS